MFQWEWSPPMPSHGLHGNIVHQTIILRMKSSLPSAYVPVQVALSDVPPSLEPPPSHPSSPLPLDPDPWDLSPVLAQKLKNRDVTNTLQQLPLLTAMEEESSGGISGSPGGEIHPAAYPQ